MEEFEPAPIVLFVYNRLEHTIRTVEALKNNELADLSDLIIYSDAPKSSLTEDSVKQVREYIKTIDGFRSVKVIERDVNWGLARSIIDGVTAVINQYGKVIVLEDDILTSPLFLRFMNKALVSFKTDNRIWHISGWNYPISPDGLGDVFFWRVMNCWGWATWSDRWEKFEKNPQKLINEQWPDERKKRFNLDGAEDFWNQVVANSESKISTWAIFWYVSIFKNNGLCLNPSITFVNNIGLDGTGEHCGDMDSYLSEVLNSNMDIIFARDLSENELAVSRIKEYYRSLKEPLVMRAFNKFVRSILKLLNFFK